MSCCLQGGETSTVSCSWTPSISGIYNITSHVSSSSSVLEDSVSANVTTEAGVVKVPLCRRSIQDAVNAAQPGDTIWVAKGTYHEIVNVWKNNLTIHGESKTDTVVNCSGNPGWGFVCDNKEFIHISGFTVKRTIGGTDDKSDIIRYAGILLARSLNCTVMGNIIEFNEQGNPAYGLLLTWASFDNVITDNIIFSNQIGMAVDCYSQNNTIARNHFYWNFYSEFARGLLLEQARNNIIYHNNFTTNEKNVEVIDPEYSTNIWDNGYPSGGNYWDDYNGTDQYKGPYQNETGRDGIGDQPHSIAPNNQDQYPLMYPWPIIHDVAVTNVWPSKNLVYPGETVYIYVTVKNEGNRMPETFDVTAYATGFYKRTIGTKTVTDLPPGNQTTLTFVWDTRGVNPIPDYTISAEASIVFGETDTADNVYVDGKVRFRGPLSIGK